MPNIIFEITKRNIGILLRLTRFIRLQVQLKLTVMLADLKIRPFSSNYKTGFLTDLRIFEIMNIMNILWSGGISLQSVRKPTAGNLHHHISLPTTPHRLVIPTNNFQTKDIKIKSETKKIRARINLSNYICPPHLTVWSFQIHFSKLIKHCQRHNGPEGWVHIKSSTQILIKF